MERSGGFELTLERFGVVVDELEAQLNYRFQRPRLLVDAIAWVPARNGSAEQFYRYQILEWLGRFVEHELSLDLILRRQSHTESRGGTLQNWRYCTGSTSVRCRAAAFKLANVVRRIRSHHGIRESGSWEREFYKILLGLYGAVLQDSGDYEQLGRSFASSWGQGYASLPVPWDAAELLAISGFVPTLGLELSKMVTSEWVVRSIPDDSRNPESCRLLFKTVGSLSQLVRAIDQLGLRKNLLAGIADRARENFRNEDLRAGEALNVHLARLLWTEGYAAARDFMDPILRAGVELK